jgi:lipopolysaccharide transport system ATP-binding protein
MSDAVIQADNLWKRYRLGVIGTGTLRHDFNRWWHRVRGKPDPNVMIGAEERRRDAKSANDDGKQDPDLELSDDEMWALRGVSFEAKQGEILGVIGPNGAGKSTLLKILSRVTAPTSGEARVKGRIVSLLEVGTGFHGELTGRENVFLNGARLDEIIDFSGVEKFIDTPVKRYSSGMYMRLAFAVAAHLEAEILIVDEVLAVGDAEFQKKCLGKMEEVSKGGRTVLFVSHHLPSVQRLCSHGIYLESGTITVAGTAHKAIEGYLSSSQLGADGRRQITVKEAEARIIAWEVLGNNESRFSCVSRETTKFAVTIESKISIPSAQIGFVIRSLTGDIIVSANSRDDFQQTIDLAPGRTGVVVTVRLPLKMGRYQLDLALADEKMQLLDHWLTQPFLTIIPNDNSVLPEEWRGWLNEPVEFNVSSK